MFCNIPRICWIYFNSLPAIFTFHDKYIGNLTHVDKAHYSENSSGELMQKAAMLGRKIKVNTFSVEQNISDFKSTSYFLFKNDNLFSLNFKQLTAYKIVPLQNSLWGS